MSLTARKLACLIGAMVLAAFWTPPAEAKLESPRTRGAKAGREDGKSAGEAAGYRAAYEAAHRESYDATAKRLIEEGTYRRNPLFTLAVFPLGFLGGFALQFALFYVLRWTGLFHDIDRILLGKEATELNLKTFRREMSEAAPGEASPAAFARSEASRVALSLLFAGVVAFAGCQSAEDKTWQKAYDAQYEKSFQYGQREGEVRGRDDGLKAGVIAAEADMKSGRAWALYSSYAGWSAFFGFLTGVTAQYLVLLISRRKRRIPQFLTVAFVPAMKRSFTYTVFERRRTFLTDIRVELKTLQARQQIEAKKLEEVKAGLQRKLDAIASIEELKQARLLTLAEEEIANLLVASEASAREYRDADDEEAIQFLNTCYCPYCNHPVVYNGNSAGDALECPHEDCGEFFRLPLALRGGES